MNRWLDGSERRSTHQIQSSSCIVIFTGSIIVGCSIIGSGLLGRCEFGKTGSAVVGAPSSPSSLSLSSPGIRKTNSFPFTSRLFLMGASNLLELSPTASLEFCLLSLSVFFPLDLSFFFCLFARFLAVFVSAISSASRLFFSYSAVIAS